MIFTYVHHISQIHGQFLGGSSQLEIGWFFHTKIAIIQYHIILYGIFIKEEHILGIAHETGT